MAEKLSLCGNLYTGYRPFCENAKTGEIANQNHLQIRDQSGRKADKPTGFCRPLEVASYIVGLL
jgi:hypothetical protein